MARNPRTVKEKSKGKAKEKKTDDREKESRAGNSFGHGILAAAKAGTAALDQPVVEDSDEAPRPKKKKKKLKLLVKQRL